MFLKKFAGLLLFPGILFAGCSSCPFPSYQGKGLQSGEENWVEILESALPLFGHRNWILVADSAYPCQSRKGIQTVATNASQMQVVEAVLKSIGKTKHIRPTIYIDKEMKYVAEKDAKGITAYREALSKILSKHSAEEIPHEKLIEKLDQAAATFHVLVLKTNMTLPYTSVFFELQCGYWGEEEEKRLREEIGGN